MPPDAPATPRLSTLYQKLSITRLLLATIALFVLLLVVRLTVGLDDVNLVANVVVFVQAIRIMWFYHRNTSWQLTRVGRTTMAIKAGILVFAVAGLLRRAKDFELFARPPGAPLRAHPVLFDYVDALGDAVVCTAWVVMMIALVARLDVLRTLQTMGAYQKEPPLPDAHEDVEDTPA